MLTSKKLVLKKEPVVVDGVHYSPNWTATFSNMKVGESVVIDRCTKVISQVKVLVYRLNSQNKSNMHFSVSTGDMENYSIVTRERWDYETRKISTECRCRHEDSVCREAVALEGWGQELPGVLGRLPCKVEERGIGVVQPVREDDLVRPEEYRSFFGCEQSDMNVQLFAWSILIFWNHSLTVVREDSRHSGKTGVRFFSWS